MNQNIIHEIENLKLIIENVIKSKTWITSGDVSLKIQ